MPLAQLRKIFLWSFIGFLTVTALIAVVCLFGKDFGELQLKVLATTFTISAASICAMACAAFIEKRGSRPWGFAGLLLATAAAAFVILGIWLEAGSDDYWKVTVTLIVISVAYTHALLMHIPTLSPAYRWTRVIAVVLVSALVIELIYVIFNVDDNHEDIFRLIAASSVFVVLLTLVIPICAKLGGSNQKVAGEKLVLEKVSDDVFTDPSGRKYRVSAVENE